MLHFLIENFRRALFKALLVFIIATWMQMEPAEGSMRFAVTSHFHDKEDCHRGFEVNFDDFDLGSALRQISDLPQSWTSKLFSQLKVGEYPPSKVARHCSLNGETFESVIDMGYYVCHNAIDIDQGSNSINFKLLGKFLRIVQGMVVKPIK